MKALIARRALQGVMTLLVIATLIFFLFRLGLPDPAVIYLGGLGFTEEDIHNLTRQFGLDKPLRHQYVDFLANTVRGEFGSSYYYRARVGPIVVDRLLNTLAFTLPALVISLGFGAVMGILLVMRRGRQSEGVGIAAGLFLRSAPLFWTGMLGILLFTVWLGWLPGSGMRTIPYEATSFLDKILTLDFLRHLILPASILGLHFAAVPMLLMRNTMLESLGEDFVEFARARGLSERRIMFAHVARNSLLPIVTYAAIGVAFAVGGSVVIEVVFSWPGLGREMVQAVSNRDYPMAQATFLLLSAVVIVLNFVADLLYMWLDPRVSHERHRAPAG